MKLKKSKKFHFLRHQVAALFVVLLLLSILMINIINQFFLENYYVSQKEEVLLKAKDALEQLDLDALLEQGSTRDEWRRSDDEEAREQDVLSEEFDKISSKNNLSWAIIDKDNSRGYCWRDDEKIMRIKLFGYAYDIDSDKDNGRILQETDSWHIQQISDRFSGMEYVECWGQFDNGIFFLIRTPLASIRENASISNRFYSYVGILIVVVSGLCIWLVTKHITKPISELTQLSEKMSALDFEARYTSRAGNEIDLLGDNFNKMSRQLEQTISELKSANNQLQKDIEDRIKIDKMRKEFLDNVSHELKTPIALVQGYAEGLKENISDDPESMNFYCDVIMDEAAKMNKLVKNLLTLNHLESGQDAPVMEHFDLVSLIRGVLQSMDIMIQQKEAKVIFEPEGTMYVWADEFKTEEVVTNYISNALNHLEGDCQIEIRLLEEENRVKVTVFNTGKPIPEEDLPKLWNKFYKVDKARTREYGGSGIGLSIVKAILEGMNQEYGVNNYDNGVEFWFTLDRK